MTKSIRDEFLLSAQPSEEEEDYPNYNEEILEGKAVSYTHLTLPTICSV